MNNLIFKFLISCIMISLLFSNFTIVQSITNDEAPIIAKNFNTFKEALENANDGDVIYITGNSIVLDYDTNATIGYSDKTITIKRISGSDHILLTGTKNIKFQNIIFDGENKLSYEPIVRTSGEYYPLASANFENVVFKNINGNNDGAVLLNTGTITFNNCVFKNNKGTCGGHIIMRGDAIVTLYKCYLTEGQANEGGAIALNSPNLSCNIISSTITGNLASSEGGGIHNSGNLTIENTKIYNNTATVGGSDIYNNGNLDMKDSIEDLQKLFSDIELKPIAWISDYNDDYSYLKLQLEKIEKEENKNDKDTENNENNDPSYNQENENNTDKPTSKPSNDEKNIENNEIEKENQQDNESLNQSNKNESDNNVTNNLHNDPESSNEANSNDEKNTNDNYKESSLFEKLTNKITTLFNPKSSNSQNITDDFSKAITNNNESPINQEINISASPLSEKDDSTNFTRNESNDPSNQSFNFTFDFKNNDDTYNLIIIFIFIQSILITIILVILLAQNKRNNSNHRYKNKNHYRKH